MADLALSIGAKISEYLVEPLLIRPLRPIFCFKSFVGCFEVELEKLNVAQVKVKDAVMEANDNALEIHNDVKIWLEEADSVMKDARILQKKLKENKASCFSSGWTRRYQLSKKACKVTDSIKKVSANSESLNKVAHLLDLVQHIELSFSEESMISKYTDSALQEIMEALTMKDVNKVGVYGTGGVVKTLAKRVFKEAKRVRMFDRVVLVPDPDDDHIPDAELIMWIQGVIADHVNLILKQETREGRASRLHKRLTNGQKILIILDNVRKKFDLGAVGIPSSVCCKVLLRTPDRRVCDIMKTQRNIQVGDWYEDEPLDLLKYSANVVDSVILKVDAANKVFTNVLTLVSLYLLLLYVS